jgi:hypothetical protein
MDRVPTEREIRNRRITAVVLVVAAVVGILAAADVGPFSDETEGERAREAVERFVAARDERDFGAVCELLTPTLKRQVQATSGARPGTEPPSCAQVLDIQAQAARDRDREGELEIVEVSVSGNRGRASVEQAHGISRSIALELIEGEWRVSTLAS